MSTEVRYRLQALPGGNIILKDFRDGMVPARPYATFYPNADHPQEHRRLAEEACRLLNADWRASRAAKPWNQEPKP